MRRRVAIAVGLIVLVVFGGRLLMLFAARGLPAGGDLAPLVAGQHRVAIVFGAGLAPGGGPSPLLDDRLREAEALFRAGIVDRLLMSGDNSIAEYNEPGAMRAASIGRGIPADAVAVDYGGRRTWDSCARARDVFGVTDAVVVTSDFHLARTAALCREAGINVQGASGADTGGYGFRVRSEWRLRELAASWRGTFDVWIHHPDVPVGGEPIDIYDPEALRRSLAPADRGAG